MIYKLLINIFLGEEAGICKLDGLSYLLSPTQISSALQSLIENLASWQDDWNCTRF